MGIWSEHKRNNNDVKYANILQKYLLECEKNGFRPSIRSDAAREYAKITCIMRIRNTKGQPTSPALLELLNKISQIPTFQKQKLINKQQTIEATQANWNKQIDQTQEFFPKVGLIHVLYGPEMYNHVIKAFKNPTNAKFLSEYIDFILSPLDKRTYDILMMFIGFYSPNIQSKKKFSSKNTPFPPRGMHPQIIANSFGLTKMRIIQIINNATRTLREKMSTKVIEHYINGNCDAMLTEMPKNLCDAFKLQQRNKITDMKTHDINTAAEWIYDNFPFNREIPTPDQAVSPRLNPLEQYYQKHK